MKITVTEERRVCDFCHKGESYKWNSCLNCGKDICYDCRAKVAKQYGHGVHVNGSGDGQYCNECDAELTKAGNDPTHNAYRAINSLRNELTAWSEDFEKRRKLAEDALKRLQGG